MASRSSSVSEVYLSITAMIAAAIWTFAALSAQSADFYGDFDWRKHDGGNYSTPVRNQGSCGSCWAFGSVASLESQFEINAGDPNLNLDLSEQHLLCDGSAGSCDGGYSYKANNFFVDNGIVDEATLPYEASDTSPNWPLDQPYDVYKVSGVDNWIDSSRTNIKNTLENEGPLSCAINTDDWYSPSSAQVGSSMDFSVSDGVLWDSAGVLGASEDPLGGVNHSVAIVGYEDDSSMEEGGYWIVKNSWGSGWGDDGYGFFKYGDIEKHDRVHSITGDTFIETIPEPSSLILLALGALVAVILNNRRRGAAHPAD